MGKALKYRPTMIGITALALVSLAVVTSTTPTAAAPGAVLFVTASPATPTAAEDALVSRLRAAGGTVTLADDNTVTAAQASSHTFALISTSVSSNVANVVTQLSGSTKPVWVAKPYLLDNFGLTGPAAESDYGNLSTRTATVIGGHPMSAGRSGLVTLFSVNQTIGWGRATTASTQVATVVVAGMTRQTAFVVPKGEFLAGGARAPGCRLTFPMPGSPTVATADYWALFDATAQYAGGGCAVGPVDTPPTVSITSPAAQAVVAGAITVRADATDDVGVVSVTFAVDGNNLATDTDGADGWTAGWNTTTVADGEHTLRARAVDAAGQSVESTVAVTVRNATTRSVLLVVANPAAPTTVENAITVRLRQNGATVVVADDNTVTAASAAAHAYVLVSPSVSSNAAGVATGLASSSRPVWVAKPYLLDNYGLTGNVAEADYGNTSVRTGTILGGHPMSAGRSGTVTLFSVNQTIGWGRAPASATQIATVAAAGTVRATAFVIAKDEPLAAGMPAPGCRLTFPLPGNAARATADYWALFDATDRYAADSCAIPPVEPVDDKLLLLISIDGLNPEAITTLGPAGTPAFHRLMTEGASTLNARSTYESTQTLPNHTSMVTGRPVTETGGHQVTFNEDNGSTVHVSAGGYVTSAFDVAHDNGLPTSLYVGKTKFDFVDRSWNAANGAPDVVGADDGPDKVDTYVVGTGGTNTPALIARMQAGLTGFTMLHFHEPDGAGHGSGYMSQTYLEAVTRTDAWIGQLLTAIAADPSLAARTTVLVTSDHGGLGTSHADATQLANYRVPFLAWGAEVSHGADLYQLNPDRTDPGTGRPTYAAAGQPVRSAEAANLIAELLGLQVLPGSRINTNQSLDLTSP